MINKVILTGRLTKDLELKYTQGSGIAYVRFQLAVNRMFSNQQGEREADFPSIVVWKKQAENLVKYMKKGSLIGVVGRITTGSYIDSMTQKKVYTTEVTADEVKFLDKINNQTGSNQYGGNDDYPPGPEPDPNQQPGEDDLPF